MSSNFEWQKHQANERVQARLQEAQVHWQAKQGNGRMPFALPLRMAILIGVGVIVALWLLTSCTTAGTMVVDSETAVVAADGQAARGEIETGIEIGTGSSTRRTMAERIGFQDRREQYLAADMGHVMDPADRKFFNAGGLAPAAAFDSEQAAEAQAFRWQAMARFYEEQARRNVNSEQAAEAQAFRWQAMARFYEKNGMLNFDYEQAAEVQAFRWQAMARYYEKAGLLTR